MPVSRIKLRFKILLRTSLSVAGNKAQSDRHRNQVVPPEGNKRRAGGAVHEGNQRDRIRRSNSFEQENILREHQNIIIYGEKSIFLKILSYFLF